MVVEGYFTHARDSGPQLWLVVVGVAVAMAVVTVMSVAGEGR